MEKTAVVRLVDGLRFVAETGSGHRLEIDGPGPEATGPRPKELLLVAQAGCTGMDVAAILAKMRAPCDRLEVEARGTEAPDHPKVFTDVEVVYRCWGPPETRDKLVRAVELSLTKYCGVSHMLGKAARMRHRVEFNGEVIEAGETDVAAH